MLEKTDSITFLQEKILVGTYCDTYIDLEGAATTLYLQVLLS